MKKNLIVVFSIVFLSIAGCQTATPEPTPTPAPTLTVQQQFAADWNVSAEKMVEVHDQNWLRCTDCSADNQQNNLNIPNGYSILVITVRIINKSTLTNQISPMSIGISLSSKDQDCGRLGVGEPLCSLEGYKIGNQLYVPKGDGMFPFMSHFNIDPNAPDGELVDIYFIVQTGAKVASLHFVDLPPIDVNSLNP